MIHRLPRPIPLLGLSLLALLAGCAGPDRSPAAPSAEGPVEIDSFAAWQDYFKQLPADELTAMGERAEAALEGTALNGSNLIGAFTAKMDFSTGEIRVVPPTERTAAEVLDVTPFLFDPSCPNGACVDFIINRRDAGTGFTSLTAFIFNFSPTTVWDVRFIWTNLQDQNRLSNGEFFTDDDIELLNMDGWTNEFDDFGDIAMMAPGAPDYQAFTDIRDTDQPGWPMINPFHSMGENFADRSLPGGEASFTTIEAIIPGDTSEVTFIVTASTLGQRQDPYEFGPEDPFEADADNKKVLQIPAFMDDSLAGQTEIRVFVRDHQFDEGFTNPADPDPTHQGVEFTSPFIFETAEDDIRQADFILPAGGRVVPPTGSPYWVFTIQNWQAKRAGRYPFYVRAHSDVDGFTQTQGWDLYWKGEILVTRDPTGGGGGGPIPQNTFAYHSAENGEFDIIVETPQGSGTFTYPNSDVAIDLQPALSPPIAWTNGGGGPGTTKRYAAWVSNATNGSNYRIFIWDMNPRNPSGGGFHAFAQPIPVTGQNEDCFAPTWSPLADAIACQCVDNRGDFELREYPITLSPADAFPVIGAPRFLTPGRADFRNPSYDATGTYIAFDSTMINASNSEIFVLDRNSTAIVQRMTFSGANDRNPSWSPFNQMLFESDSAGDWDILALEFQIFPPMSGNGISIEPIVTSSGDDLDAAISPDGRELIFATNRGASGDFDIYTANSGGGNEVRKNLPDEVDQASPAWAEDVFFVP